ncbi:MAG TPA: hypothetical protein VEP50_15130 [bacterium]|nr:hypothetical protein [bacterium]
MRAQKYRITIEFEAVSRADRRDITTMVSEIIKDAVRLYGPGLLDAKVVSVMLDSGRSGGAPSVSFSGEVRQHH